MTRQRLIDEIEARIRVIPASNPGHITFYPQCLENILSKELIYKIAEVAADAALEKET